MGLSKDQVARYSRQLILPEVGVHGQECLLRASVLIIGAGGLGCPAALYLAAAGVGTIGVMDEETVALSNLHRQILHTLADVGQPKTRSAQRHMQARNPAVSVHALHERLTTSNAPRYLQSYDLILDGADNFPTRYLINDACVLYSKPLVHGAAIGFGGQLLTILPRQSACVRCVFPEPPHTGAIPSCQEAGVLGSVTGIVGSLMAHEALKILLGVGTPLTNRLLVVEGLTSRFREVAVRRNPACAVCGDHPMIRELIAIEEPVCATATSSSSSVSSTV